MKKKGFTLIELLVVISIISFLSSIVIGQFNSARSKARDTRRIQDLTQIRNALELYYLENGIYPVANTVSGLNLTLNPPTSCCPAENWLSLENYLNKYLSPLPIDPINKDVYAGSGWKKGSYFYTYWSINGGKAYSIFASLENPRSNVSRIDRTVARCNWTDVDCMYNEKNGGFGFVNK